MPQSPANLEKKLAAVIGEEVSATFPTFWRVGSDIPAGKGDSVADFKIALTTVRLGQPKSVNCFEAKPVLRS